MKLLLCIIIAVAGTECLRGAEECRPMSDDVKELVADSTPSPPQDLSMALERELAAVLSGANKRIPLGPTWARAPASTVPKRFSFFKKHNESRWNLGLDPSKVPVGTVYEYSQSTEEGEAVSEYLVFGSEQVTWWFDGHQDRFSEFKNPSIRKMKVVRLFLAIHDGEVGWDPIEKKGAMPLDRGLSVGIELQDGSRRYW